MEKVQMKHTGKHLELAESFSISETASLQESSVDM